MIRILAYGALLLIYSGCADSTGNTTGLDASTDSLLVEILVDLHRADAAIYLSAQDSLDTDAANAIGSWDFSDDTRRDSVLAAHGLDNETFMVQIEEQLSDPERFLSTYNRVLDRTSVLNN